MRKRRRGGNAAVKYGAVGRIVRRGAGNAGGFGCLAFGLALLLAGVVWCASSPVFAAQGKRPFSIHVHTNVAQAPIRETSNLVLVPAFVYNKHRLKDQPSHKCANTSDKLFNALLPSQPFPPKDCSRADILGLTVKDFRLFQDGVEQQIQSVMGASWRITVRDNMGKHREFTENPAGIWSTPDLGPSWDAFTDAHFYLLAYVPPETKVKGCQPIEVKVDRRDAVVRARKDWCSGQTATDPLNGTLFGKQMEQDLASPDPGKIPLALQAGFTYTNPNRARVDIALKFPWGMLHYQVKGGYFHAMIGVLGAAYRKNGVPAARFSSLGCCSPNSPDYFKGGSLKGQVRGLFPAFYQTQIDLTPGQYELQVVLSDDTKFGRAEAPLDIPAYRGKRLALSSVLLCKRYRPAHVAEVERAAVHFAPNYVPLVSQGVQFTPSGSTGFKKGEPLLAKNPKTEVEAEIKIVNRTTGKVAKDFPPVNAAPYIKPGSTAIHIARKIPFKDLPPGPYKLEVRATDSAGQSTPWHSADFTIEKGRWKYEPLQIIK